MELAGDGPLVSTFFFSLITLRELPRLDPYEYGERNWVFMIVSGENIYGGSFSLELLDNEKALLILLLCRLTRFFVDSFFKRSQMAPDKFLIEN